MSAYAKDYTLEELIISRMAKEMKGERGVVAGATFCSMIAVSLAKRLYAPDMIEFGGSVKFFDSPSIPSFVIREFIGDKNAKASLNWLELFDCVFLRKWLVWIGPAQIDQYGNANISVIGDWKKPTTALIGARGLPDDGVRLSRMVYHVVNHNPRSFPAKVDFICAVGFGRERKELGIQYGEPSFVISNLGVFDFDKESGRMKIQSLHPGVNLDIAIKNTGFELIIPSDIPETELPTEEEVDLIRNQLDPFGIRKMEVLKGEKAGKLRVEIIQKEMEYLKTVRGQR